MEDNVSRPIRDLKCCICSVRVRSMTIRYSVDINLEHAAYILRRMSSAEQNNTACLGEICNDCNSFSFDASSVQTAQIWDFDIESCLIFEGSYFFS